MPHLPTDQLWPPCHDSSAIGLAIAGLLAGVAGLVLGSLAPPRPRRVT